MASKGLSEVFIDEVRDTYDAERQLTRALPKMAKAASSPALKQAFTSHLQETLAQIDRLEHVFDILDERVRGKRCEGMAGIIDEGAALLEEDFDEATMDATLIGAAQRVEHYEIAAYGTLIAWAQQLGHMDISDLLQASLQEEKGADEQLTILAQDRVNQNAADEPDEDEDASDEDEEADEAESKNQPASTRRKKTARARAR